MRETLKLAKIIKSLTIIPQNLHTSDSLVTHQILGYKIYMIKV